MNLKLKNSHRYNRQIIRKHFTEEAIKWEKMNTSELDFERKVIESSLPKKAVFLINKVLFRSAEIVSIVLLWVLILYIMNVLLDGIIDFEVKSGWIFLVAAIISMAIVLFVIWGVFAEEGKLIEALFYPLTRWKKRIMSQQNEFDKIRAIEFFIEEKEKQASI